MKKILIIDDEADLSKALATRLSANGYETRTALDAMQGFAEVHRSGPALIILDLQLPAGGGLSLLQRLRVSTNTKTLPVIVITGNVDVEIREKVLAMGVQGYVMKPYDFENLLEKIAELVGT